MTYKRKVQERFLVVKFKRQIDFELLFFSKKDLLTDFLYVRWERNSSYRQLLIPLPYLEEYLEYFRNMGKGSFYIHVF